VLAGPAICDHERVSQDPTGPAPAPPPPSPPPAPPVSQVPPTRKDKKHKKKVSREPPRGRGR